MWDKNRDWADEIVYDQVIEALKANPTSEVEG